jgi:adenosine deaminase
LREERPIKYGSEEHLKKIPKTDLHVHLDGSLRLDSLIEMARDLKVELPSGDPEGLCETVFKPSYASLDEYLKGFAYTCAVLQHREMLERAAYELAIDNALEGVYYLEVRFAPQLHINQTQDFEAVMQAVNRGLANARKEINLHREKGEPEFEFGIIVCAMRFCNEHFSEYYRQFFAVHRFRDPQDVIQLASLELANAASRLARETDVQLVGFDLAGSEYGYPADDHRASYDLVHANFLKKTVHAGEAFGPESIFQAITRCHADRIGHGLFLFDENAIADPAIEDRKDYIEALANYVADRRITIEVCLTSNLQTVPEIKSLKDHSFRKMLDHKLSTTICTDNRLVSHTTVTRELKLAIDNFKIDRRTLRNIIIYGFKRSFFYGSYRRKRAYVRQVLDYYDSLQAEIEDV